MTATEAHDAILRAANYLRHLSQEDSGTGTEAELADGLMAAVKWVGEQPAIYPLPPLVGYVTKFSRTGNPEVAHELGGEGG